MDEGVRTNRLIRAALLLLIWLCLGSDGRGGQEEGSGFQEVKVQGVIRDPRTAQPVVVLADPSGERGMLIWIGESEAMALDGALHGTTSRRPMTHDLMASVIQKLNSRILRVRVTELRDDVYYASVFLQTPQGQTEVDARPSDAVVLAVRAGCPISVEASLFQARSLPLDGSPTRSYGMEVQELTEDLKAALGYRGEGLLISQVEPGGVAEKSGLRREDILVDVAGEPVSRAADLEALLRTLGRGVEVKVFRKGKIISLTLQPKRSS